MSCPTPRFARLTRVATPETEDRLYRVGRSGTADHVERIVRGWRRIDQHVEAREARHRHRSRALSLFRADGMVILKGRLEPEVGALLIQALNAARETLYQRRRAATPAVGVMDETVEAPTMVQRRPTRSACSPRSPFTRGSIRARRQSGIR